MEFTGTTATTRQVIALLEKTKAYQGQYLKVIGYDDDAAMRYGALDLAIDTIVDNYDMDDVIHFDIPMEDK